ncbi:uncharacterized protein [Montipora foliosa]|uniref:uncharacterized protein n=1 Tax=Montipora foliosa TaxID=591990 RepID=UPI0035F17467
MDAGINQATGKPVKKTAPLKSKTEEVITAQDQQLERWVEHYLDLYSRINTVSQEALDAIEDLPVLQELDAEPTTEEISKASDSLASGKAPGEDGIPPEIIKCGKSALLQPLHELLCLCWREGKVPLDMRDSSIVTLYKCKGDCSDYNNYWGISLLSEEGVYLHSRSEGKLFSLSRVKAKTKVQTVFLGEMLFADDTVRIALAVVGSRGAKRRGSYS